MKMEQTLHLESVAQDRTDKLVMMPYHQNDMGNHDHLFFEFVYITGGTAEHVLNGKRSALSKGDYFIVDYGSGHRYENCRGLTLINCLFLPEVVDETLQGCRSLDELLQGCLIRYYRMQLGESWKDRIFRDESGRIGQLLEGMVEEYREKRLGYGEIFRCRLTEILLLTLRNVMQEQSFAQDGVVQEVIGYLEAHFAQPVKLKDFCEEAHYSLPYISRCFKQKTGMTARSYLQKLRVEKSCELLAGSDLRIYEVAKAVGYEDLKAFHKAFRRFLNMSPREYRQRS